MVLYFDKSVSRAELVERISALPELVVEDSENYWSGPVHLVFHELGREKVQSLVSADVCLDVGVYSFQQEPGRKMVDVILSLLAPGQDVVAVCDFSDVAFIQRGGELTLDSSDAVWGDEDRARFQARRPCALAVLGRLG